jgi:hypothetical protein
MVDRFDVDVTETGPGDGRYRLGVPPAIGRAFERYVVGRNPKMAVVIAGTSAFYRLSPLWPIGQWGIASVDHHSWDPNSGKRSQLKVY